MKPLLLPISWLYGLGVKCHRSLFNSSFKKQHRFSVPVVSVGNLTWGGSGKTPLTLWLAERLKQDGKKPSVLMRGFGGDEFKLYQGRDISVAANPNRVKMGEALLKKSVIDIFLLDDGFQHWPLARDLDIVCVNALNPFGNRTLIPSGSLREPRASLKRADVVVITHADQVQEGVLLDIEGEVKKFNPDVKLVWARHNSSGLYDVYGNVEQPSVYQGKPYILLCGLGSPENFSKTAVTYFGREPLARYSFRDHHRFSKKEIEEVVAEARKQDAICVITEKDWVRCQELFSRYNEIKVLKIEIKFVKGEEILAQEVNRLLESKTLNITVLSDGKKGHLKQSWGVVDLVKRGVGVSRGVSLETFETVEIRYKNKFMRTMLWLKTPFFHIQKTTNLKFLRRYLTVDSFQRLEALIEHQPDWIISAGSSLLPLQSILQRRIGNRAIIMMKPRGLYAFYPWDLVIQPMHDGQLDKENVLLTPTAVSGINEESLNHFKKVAQKNLSLKDERLVSFFVGGASSDYRFSNKEFRKSLDGFKNFVHANQMPYCVTASRRTPHEVINCLKANCGEDDLCKMLVVPTEKDEPNAFEIMMSLSHIAVVTEESVSMISEVLRGNSHVIGLSVAKRPIKGKKKRFQTVLCEKGRLHLASAGTLESVLADVNDMPPKATSGSEVDDKILQARLFELV